MSPGEGQKRDGDSRRQGSKRVTRSHNFVFDPSPAIGQFGNELGKSGERIQRIRYFALASYMMKSFAVFWRRSAEPLFAGSTESRPTGKQTSSSR